GILRNRLVDIDRLFAAGETRQGVMATRPMIDRADQGAAVQPACGPRQMFANLDAGDIRGDRLELAANLNRSRRLQVEHVLGGSAAVKVKQEDVLRFALRRRRGPLRLQG